VILPWEGAQIWGGEEDIEEDLPAVLWTQPEEIMGHHEERTVHPAEDMALREEVMADPTEAGWMIQGWPEWQEAWQQELWWEGEEADHRDITMTTAECHRLAHMDDDLHLLTHTSGLPRLESMQHTVLMTNQVFLGRNLLHLYQDLKRALLVKQLRWMQQQEVLQQHQAVLAILAT
jgi:hypothetical protein